MTQVFVCGLNECARIKLQIQTTAAEPQLHSLELRLSV